MIFYADLTFRLNDYPGNLRLDICEAYVPIYGYIITNVFQPSLCLIYCEDIEIYFYHTSNNEMTPMVEIVPRERRETSYPV